MRHDPERRGGFTLIDAIAALAILAIVAVIVAQCITWSLQERARLASKQAAVELAANVLEAARALPPGRLDRAWAEAQKVPSELSEMLPEGKVVVTIEPAALAPHAQHVSVEVLWQRGPELPPRSVQLTTILSPRETKSGGTP